VTYGNCLKNGLALLISGSLYESDGDDLYFAEFDDPQTNQGIAERGDDESAGTVNARLDYDHFHLVLEAEPQRE